MGIEERGGHRVFRLEPDGPRIAAESDAVEIIGELWGQEADTVVVPVERLDPAFFALGTGIAGAVTQKFATMRIRFVVLGDISAHLATSAALTAYVAESNRGRDVWFLPDDAALDARLAA